jgi:hypothetical protein
MILMSGSLQKPEKLFRIVGPLHSLRRTLNLEKVFFTGSWEEAQNVLSGYSLKDKADLKLQAEECLEVLEEIDICIVDRFNISLIEAILGMLSIM